MLNLPSLHICSIKPIIIRDINFLTKKQKGKSTEIECPYQINLSTSACYYKLNFFNIMSTE